MEILQVQYFYSWHSHIWRKKNQKSEAKATVADSADKTEVLCQDKKDILITQQMEQGFRRNHLINLDNRDQRRNQQQHHNTAITFKYFNYPYLRND